jgi:hypothetical protein
MRMKAFRGNRVNSVEQAIRAALAKGDHTSDLFRHRIYSSASAALERSLAARTHSDTETTARRQGLAATIQHIESEFVAASEPDLPVIVQDVSDFQISAPQSENDQQQMPQMAMPMAVDANDDGRQIKGQRPSLNAARNKQPWLKHVVFAGAVLGVILLGFWAYGEGKQIYANATTSTPNSQKPVLAEQSDAGNAGSIEWIDVFSARDTDLISSPAGAKTEITSRDGINYVVMAGDGANEVSIKIGSGLVKTFAGKRVLFNIKARSTNGSILDTGTHCEFGDETKCERKRFKIGPQAAEYMFAVTVADSAIGDNALLIAADLTGAGGSVEIESIRATIVKPDAG